MLAASWLNRSDCRVSMSLPPAGGCSSRQLGHDPDEIVASTPEVATDLDDVDGLARITEPV